MLHISGRNTGSGRLPLFAVFLTGILAGIFIMNIGKSILLENTGLLDEYALYHMKYMTVNSNALFYYVLKQRMGTLLILAVSATTYLGLAVCLGMTLWCGRGIPVGPCDTLWHERNFVCPDRCDAPVSFVCACHAGAAFLV